MAGDKSTLQTIVENARDAAVQFGQRFQPPAANIVGEVKKLLAELGIADPQSSVSNAMTTVANNWKSIADTLSGISLDFTDPAAVLAGLSQKAEQIKQGVENMINAPRTALDGLGASFAAIKDEFAKRLLDYIVYEFVTKTHEKIGGAFLLLGVLRREFRTAGGNTAFIDAEIRVFDLQQLIRAITHPRESFLTVMRWGTNDFLARPVVDGMVLLLKQAAGTPGPEDDTFPLADEATFVGPPDPGVRPSARRTLTLPLGTIAFVGLHKHGVGLRVPNPISVGGNLIPAPPLPAAQIFALVPGPVPATDNPSFKILP